MKCSTLIATVLSGSLQPCSAVRTAAGRALLLLLFTACGFPRPADVGDDGGGPGDAPAPGVTVHVSPSGDDANNGLTQPVRTLKRAIAIAGTNTDIKGITLAAGRYTPNSGETFPYVVPADVTIAGEVGGGSTLAGTGAEDALTIGSAKLRDLKLDDFMTTITATGVVELTNIQIQTSKLALRAVTKANLNATNLAITGAVDSCGSGIELHDNAVLVVMVLTTRNLVTTVDARDLSTVDIAQTDVTGGHG